MFARKIRSVFDRMLPNKKKKNYTKVNTKFTTYKEGDKVFFKNYRSGKCFWEDGIVSKRIGRVIYIVKGKNVLQKTY